MVIVPQTQNSKVSAGAHIMRPRAFRNHGGTPGVRPLQMPMQCGVFVGAAICRPLITIPPTAYYPPIFPKQLTHHKLYVKIYQNNLRLDLGISNLFLSYGLYYIFLGGKKSC